VGAYVGLGDAANVVGTRDGPFVYIAIGAGVGAYVGTYVGNGVGKGVGTSVGMLVG